MPKGQGNKMLKKKTGSQGPKTKGTMLLDNSKVPSFYEKLKKESSGNPERM